MDKTFSSSSTGVGARYTWKSANRKVGEGSMTIERSERSSLVGITIEVSKPFAATIQLTFNFDDPNESHGKTNDLAGRGSAYTTKVTWAMDGQNSFMTKAFSLVMNVEQMVGSDFERGLAALKTAAESLPNATSAVIGAPRPHQHRPT
jgi:hypothetical protein